MRDASHYDSVASIPSSENASGPPSAPTSVAARSARAREVHLDEWVAPHIADERKHLRAGKILEWMDVVGVLAATRHSGRPVVTASVDGMHLVEPISVGERVHIAASVGYTSRRSLGVFVTMHHGFPEDERSRQSFSGYMTFVAVDESGSICDVPQVIPETPLDIARSREAELRREFRKKLESGAITASDGIAKASELERPLFVREILKNLPLPLRMPWDRSKPRQRNASYMHTIEPVREANLNFHGTLYGGTIMRWLENTASLSARAYLRGASVRLVGLHGLTFIRPVQRNCFVHIRSIVVHATETDLTVLVNVSAETVGGSDDIETLRAFLTYAPVPGENVRIPPVDCRTEEDRTLFEEVSHRIALQRMLRDDTLPGT
jgi:acyl-CoA hydrolase